MYQDRGPSGDDEERAARAKAALYLRLRARGLQDLRLLRAFELIPRASFVAEAYRDLAGRDLPLPIPCGQTQAPPSLLGRMIEGLRVDRAHRVLEIGAGTGYATTILASLADEVIGLERFQGLARAAHERLGAMNIVNAGVGWGDGLAPPSRPEIFDRILVHGSLREPEALLDRLTPDGMLVCAVPTERGEAGAQDIVRLEKGTGDFGRRVVIVAGQGLQPITPGVAAAL